MKKSWNVHQDLNYIVRAERCEKEGCILESQKLYEEGINKLRNSLKECINPSNQEFYKTKLKQFEQKAHFLNKHIEKATIKSQLVEQLFIPQDVRGHSFGKIFERFLNESIAEVHIYEPFMEIEQHFKNLVCFIEVLVKSCPNLQFIRLITKRDPRLTSQQLRIFQGLKADLASGDVSFNHQFNPTVTRIPLKLLKVLVREQKCEQEIDAHVKMNDNMPKTTKKDVPTNSSALFGEDNGVSSVLRYGITLVLEFKKPFQFRFYDDIETSLELCAEISIDGGKI
uniref:MIT_C domain-containing protein n=1 Tax=Glossina pallidipes TaxID=7398 RepID=A0A1A9Z7I4_GLOPL